MDCFINGSCEYPISSFSSEDEQPAEIARRQEDSLSNSAQADPQAETAQRASGWSRFWGGVKAVGGAAETAAGIAFGAFTSWSGIGAAAGVGVAAHGGDTVVAGLRQAWTGKNTSTITAQGISAVTGNETYGELADAAIGIAGTAGVGLLSRASAAETVAVKTVQWTSSLPPGSGRTSWFGSMVLSKLGSALDRAQVFIHENVHSLLSPSSTSMFARARADLRAFLYSKSSLMRYSEEALAETAAQLSTRSASGRSTLEAVKTGLSFPVQNGYVRAQTVAAEAAGAAAKFADTERRVWEATE